MTNTGSGSASVLAMPPALLWAMALLLLLQTSFHQVHAKGAFQSGRMNGAVYAGGLDSTTDDIFFTGITYGTNGGAPSEEAHCFVSRKNNMLLGNHSETLTHYINNEESLYTCRAVSLLHDASLPEVNAANKPNLLVAGMSVPTFGFISFVQENDDNQFDERKRLEVSIDYAGQTGSVSYPVSVIFVKGQDDSGQGDKTVEATDRIAYVASLSSTNLAENPGNVELMKGSNNQPNWLKYYTFGSSFELNLQKLTRAKGRGNTFEATWTKIYPADVNEQTSSNPEVFVGGMILNRRENRDYLIVAGSTSGSGAVYGNSESGTSDEDGFISVFDGRTGELRTINAKQKNQNNAKSTTRIGTAETDLVLGICDDPNDPGHFYIVGATGDPIGMGDRIRSHSAVLMSYPGSLHGFVQKIKFNDLTRVWGKTWSANFGFGASGDRQSITAGYSCKVIEDGSLYVAGIVEDGAHVNRDHVNSHNHDDIVALRFTAEGDLQWMNQFGSEDGNEDLARSGAVAVDQDENLVILGDTTGSLFRKRNSLRDDSSNIFLITLSKEDGSHEASVPANHEGAWEFGHIDDPKIGMLSGGKWKDDEVYGMSKWADKAALGIQSGPTAGSVFAGGMVYDDTEDTVYVTGIAYNDIFLNSENVLSSCMLTKLSLGESGFSGWGSANGKVIGTNGVLEVCDSIALHGYDEVVVVGSADNGSPLQNGNDYPMAGFAMALDRFDLTAIDETSLITELPNNRIQYPIDIVGDGDAMYVVSMTSTNNELTPDALKLLENDGHGGFAPNWINMKKYGASFDMTVTKLTLEEQTIDGVKMDNIAFTTQWSKEFPVDYNDGDDGGIRPRVLLGGAILKKSEGYLAVSGSTRGIGEGYGAATGNDEDGFVTLLDTDTGELFESDSVTKNNIREGTSQDDVVLGMCHDQNDDSFFYIVGGTNGLMPGARNTTAVIPGSMHAFLLKVDARTLSTVWTVQLGAVSQGNDGGTSLPTIAKAFDCAVSSDTVYAGGIVDNNAGLVFNKRPRSSRGGDDIWLGSFAIGDGEINWLRQMGSEGNDHIAPRGGLAIKKNGNVLIFGDTNGEFYRERSAVSKVNELFLMEVDKNGAYKPHVKHQKHDETKAPTPGAPAPAPSPSIYVPVPGSPQSTAPPFLINDISLLEKGHSRGVLIGLSVGGSLVAIVFGIIIVFCCRKRFSNRRRTLNTAPKAVVRDGIMNVDNSYTSSRTPPPSSFRDNPGFLDGSDDNLNIAAKGIV